MPKCKSQRLWLPMLVGWHSQPFMWVSLQGSRGLQTVSLWGLDLGSARLLIQSLFLGAPHCSSLEAPVRENGPSESLMVSCFPFLPPSVHPATHQIRLSISQPSICPSIHHPSTQPSIYPFINLSIHLSTHLSINSSSIHSCIHPSVHLSISQSNHPSIHPSIHPPIHPSIHPSICPTIHHPSTHPPTHQSIHPPIHPPPICPCPGTVPALCLAGGHNSTPMARAVWQVGTWEQAQVKGHWIPGLRRGRRAPGACPWAAGGPAVTAAELPRPQQESGSSDSPVFVEPAGQVLQRLRPLT